MTEPVDKIVREFIDFVNRQVGAYMDALAGFEGHYTRVERQVHRENRPIGTRTDEKGQQIVVWACYEDPTKPDIIHNRIIRAKDYLEANSKDGSNSQQHSQAILVFIFSYWDEEIRPRLAASRGVDKDSIKSDIMGDLREVRHAILHAKGIIRQNKYSKLTILKYMFEVDKPIRITYEHMHEIFKYIKQDCAQMMFDWLGVKDAPIKPEELVDVAIQRHRKDS